MNAASAIFTWGTLGVKNTSRTIRLESGSCHAEKCTHGHVRPPMSRRKLRWSAKKPHFADFDVFKSSLQCAHADPFLSSLGSNEHCFAIQFSVENFQPTETSLLSTGRKLKYQRKHFVFQSFFSITVLLTMLCF